MFIRIGTARAWITDVSRGSKTCLMRKEAPKQHLSRSGDTAANNIVTDDTTKRHLGHSRARKQLGAAGETIAIGVLQELGMTIGEQNWRCAAGELDIIAYETAPDYASGNMIATWLVAVEVRTRRGKRYGSALQSLPPKKQAKLREVAEHYVQTIGWQGPWRIDFVAVQMDEQGHLLSVDHLRHAVSG